MTFDFTMRVSDHVEDDDHEDYVLTTTVTSTTITVTFIMVVVMTMRCGNTAVTVAL